MTDFLRVLIRYGTYPIVFGVSVYAVLLTVTKAGLAWPFFALTAGAALFIIASLERIQPYQRAWLENHGDLFADILYALINLALLSGTAWLLHFMRLDFLIVWPDAWPSLLQILLAGMVIDAGLYFMHRLSHHVEWLWRLHALHHSSERLYWLNSERRHPLSAVILASPGIIAVVTLGAPPIIISAWLTLLTVHLAFQHANFDYSLGPFRKLIGVAEIHRWHHKRDYEDAQVNFGEFWMIWDHLFGTFSDNTRPLLQDEVGISDSTFPKTYMGQLRYPFITRKNATVVNDK